MNHTSRLRNNKISYYHLRNLKEEDAEEETCLKKTGTKLLTKFKKRRWQRRNLTFHSIVAL